MGRALRATARIVLLGLAAGCVRGEWSRTLRYEPLPPHVSSMLVGGVTELQSCLDLLGAPLWVWERAAHDGTGMALAYGGFQSHAFGVDIVVPVHDLYSTSLRYDDLTSRMPGIVLFFDSRDRLESWREGLLADLATELRTRRPSLVE